MMWRRADNPRGNHTYEAKIQAYPLAAHMHSPDGRMPMPRTKRGPQQHRGTPQDQGTSTTAPVKKKTPEPRRHTTTKPQSPQRQNSKTSTSHNRIDQQTQRHSPLTKELEASNYRGPATLTKKMFEPKATLFQRASFAAMVRPLC